MKPRNQQHGLTLIEFLVVVAIVAILASLLLPALVGGGHPRSKRAACLSNLKKVTLALILYAKDMKDKFPDLDQQPANDGPAAIFPLSNYIQQTNEFLCPYVVARREKDRPFYRAKFVPALNRAFFVSNGNDYAYYDGLTFSSVTNIIVADRFAWTNRAAMDITVLNHPDGIINIGFVDGHVEMAKPNIIIGTNLTPPWAKALDPIRVP